MVALLMAIIVLMITTDDVVAEDNTISFAAIADPHFNRHTGPGGEWSDDTAFAWQNDLEYPKLDFTINLGDATHFSSWLGWRNYTWGFMDHMYMPNWFVFGNHDLDNYVNKTYAENYPHEGIYEARNATGTMTNTYAFIYSNLLFIVIGDEGDECIITDWQREYLEMTCSRFSDLTTVIFSHNTVSHTTQNSYDNSTQQYLYRGFQNHTWWMSFLENNSQVKLFVHGHNHKSDFIEKYGVVWVQADTQSCSAEDGEWDDSIFVEIREDVIDVRIYDVEDSKWTDRNNFTGYENNITDSGYERFMVPLKVQDGEETELYNRIIADEHYIELIGINSSELAYNTELDYGYDHKNPIYFCGFLNDSDNYMWNGQARFNGSDEMILGIGYTHKWWIQGKVPYNMPTVVPGKNYTLMVRARANRSASDCLNVNIRFLKWNISRVVSTIRPFMDLDLTDEYITYFANFTAPAGSWLAQVQFVTTGNDTYYIDRYSVRPRSAKGNTDNFTIEIGNQTFNVNGDLDEYEVHRFKMKGHSLGRTIDLKATIGGNKAGIVQLVYERPLLYSHDSTLGLGANGSIEVERCNPWANQTRLLPLTPILLDSTTPNTTTNGYQYYEYDSRIIHFKEIIKRSEIIVVDDDNGSWCDHTSIQAAIDNASSNMTVLVYEGTYLGPIQIDRPISVVGNSGDIPVIEVVGHSSGVVINYSGASLANFKIINRNSTNHGQGIKVSADECRVTDCIVSGFDTGIRIKEGDRSTVIGSTIINTSAGIRIVDSDNVSINGTEISNEGYQFRHIITNRTDDEVITFGATTDQHYGWKKHQVLDLEAGTIQDWMNHSSIPHLDFTVASLGDWISDSRADGKWQDTDHCWKKITEMSADHHLIPYFWIPGNHDLSNYENMTDGNPMRKERMSWNISGISENCFAYMYNNVLFIGLGQTTVLTTISDFQKDWLEYLTTVYSDHTTVILTHQAMSQTTGAGDERSTSWDTNDYKVYNGLDWWHGFLDDNHQIKLYLHGHTEKAFNTTFHNDHPASWDDHCTFVSVPGNGRGDKYIPVQESWSYIFSITDDSIEIRLWDSVNKSYIFNSSIGVPYIRDGMSNNVSSSGMEWFSIPKEVQNGQNWTWKNRMVAEGYRIDLIGSNLTERIDNANLDGCMESDELKGEGKAIYWYAVRGDENAENLETGEEDGYIRIKGGNVLELATSASNPGMFIEGKVPYNTALAIPGATYNFSCEIRTESGSGLVKYLMNIHRKWSIHNRIWRNRTIKGNFSVTTDLKRYSTEFTIPQHGDMWFLQPRIKLFLSTVKYIIESWSLKIVGDGNRTENFTVGLNGALFSSTGALQPGNVRSFTVPNATMDNDLEFNCSIDGNHVGFARFIYVRPLLWSDDVSFGVNDPKHGLLQLEDVSPFNERTTIMGFDGADLGIGGFDVGIFREKPCFMSDIFNNSIDGNYSTFRANSTTGILIERSDDVGLHGNRVASFHTGVHMDRVGRSDIDGTKLRSTFNTGFDLNRSDGNIISDSICLNTSCIPVQLWSSDNNSLHGNTFMSDHCQLVTIDAESNDNAIYKNDMIGPDHGHPFAQDDGSGNNWHIDGSGNHWSNYNGTDNDWDLIGDTSYMIGGASRSYDLYPRYLPHGEIYGLLTVDDDPGPWRDFSTIGNALDNAVDGTIIRIHSGTYEGAFVVNTSVGFVGNGSDTVIRYSTTTPSPSSGGNVPFFDIRASNVTFENITLNGGSSCPIGFLMTGDHATFDSVRIGDAAIAVMIVNSSDHSFNGMEADNCTVAIDLANVTSIYLNSTSLSGSLVDIRIDNSSTIILNNSSLSGNGTAIDLYGSTGIDARWNHWGTISEMNLLDRIDDGTVDLIPAAVLYSPWYDNGFQALYHHDSSQPVTTHDDSPFQVIEGEAWAIPPISLDLNATDGSGTGVLSTAYRLFDGKSWTDWLRYNGSIHINASGTYLLEYNSTDMLGNEEAPRSFGFHLDASTPKTVHDHNGFWSSNNVNVQLTANHGGSGIRSTHYRIDNGTWITGSTIIVSAPANHSNDGIHLVEFYSIDNLGKEEDVNAVLVKIDTTPPEIVIRFNTTTKKYTFGSNDTSGHGSQIVLLSKFGSSRIYLLEDHVGLSAVVKLQMRSFSSAGWKTKKVVLKWISYDGQPSIKINKDFMSKFRQKNGAITNLKQSISGGTEWTDTVFRAKTDKTKVRSFDGSLDVSVMTGCADLSISTKNGDVLYSCHPP